MKSLVHLLFWGVSHKVPGACRKDELDNFQGSLQNENETSPPCSKSMKNAKTVAAEHRAKHGVGPSETRVLRSQAHERPCCRGSIKGRHEGRRRRGELRGALRAGLGGGHARCNQQRDPPGAASKQRKLQEDGRAPGGQEARERLEGLEAQG